MIDMFVFSFIIEHPAASALMLAAVLWWALGWQLLPSRELARLWGRTTAGFFTR